MQAMYLVLTHDQERCEIGDSYLVLGMRVAGALLSFH